MKYQDFLLLSTRMRKEFVLSSCEFLITRYIDDDLVIDLFHSFQGNFFIEIFYSLKEEKCENISAYTDIQRIHKFLGEIDIREIHEHLDSGSTGSSSRYL